MIKLILILIISESSEYVCMYVRTYACTHARAQQSDKHIKLSYNLDISMCLICLPNV